LPADPPDPSRLADTAVPVHPLIATRWSPRALDPGAVVAHRSLTAMLEAARWAASWGGTQPARFVVGRRGDETFDALVALLSRGNQAWAPNAGALLLGVTAVRAEDTVYTHGAFDLGQAVAHVLLQAVAEGLVAHPMAGFDADAARERFAIPADYQPLVLVAVGTPGDPAALPERVRTKEIRPRSRKPLSEVAFTGTWGQPWS